MTEKELDKQELVKVPLFQHQKKAILYAVALFQLMTGEEPRSHGFSVLADMGTGKTLLAIALMGLMYLLGIIDRILIVAPLSILSVWRNEFEKFANFPFRLTVLQGTGTKKKQQIASLSGDGLKIVITNYESAWRLLPELLEYNADVVIADEMHKLKDGRTAQSKGMHKLGDKARYRIGMTGTVISGREIDAWSQYRFVEPAIFGTSFLRFRNEYFYMGGYEAHVPFFRATMGPEFLQRLHSIAFRITRQECLDLPEATDEIRSVALEPAALKLYKEIEQDSYAQLMESEVSAPNILTRLLRLSQIAGGFITDDDKTVTQVSSAKLDALSDILDSAQAAGQKLVIMARFIAEMDAIEAMLAKKQIRYSVIRGGVKDRDEQIRRFQEESKTTVFLGQIAAAGLGLTLTAASTMVFFSMDYSMANHTQAKARIHRAGQKNACLYIYLLAEGTVDHKVFKALQNKQDLARMLIDEYRMGINPYQNHDDEIEGDDF